MEFNEREHNYIEEESERENGHCDTRSQNLRCEGALGCNMGIDVAG